MQKIGIVGLWYVWLPLAYSFDQQGFDVVGFDIVASNAFVQNDCQNSDTI